MVRTLARAKCPPPRIAARAHAARRVALSLAPARIAMSVVAHFAGHMTEALDDI